MNGAIFALSAMTMGVSTWIAVDSAGKHGNAKHAQVLSQLVANQARMIESMALERGQYSATISGEGAATPAAKEEVSRRRGEVDGFITTFNTTLEKMPADKSGAYHADIAGIAQSIKAARDLAEGGFNVTRAQRPADLPSRYLKQVVATTSQVRTLIARLEADITRHDGEIARAVPIISISADLRDMAGSRSSWFSQYVASRRTFTPEVSIGIHEADGRISYVWNLVERAAQTAGATPGLQEAVAHARKRFIEEGDARYAAIAAAGRSGADPGIGIDAWRAWTLEALASITKLRDAAIARVEADAASSVAEARMMLWVSLVAVLVSALIAIGFVVVVTRRVTRPLTHLSRAISEVANGKFDIDLPVQRYNDEIT